MVVIVLNVKDGIRAGGEEAGEGVEVIFLTLSYIWPNSSATLAKLGSFVSLRFSVLFIVQCSQH
jgi:hypothetical protein